jgi:hypothetical protein
MKKTIISLLGILALSIFLSGCDDDAQAIAGEATVAEIRLCERDVGCNRLFQKCMARECADSNANFAKQVKDLQKVKSVPMEKWENYKIVKRRVSACADACYDQALANSVVRLEGAHACHREFRTECIDEFSYRNITIDTCGVGFVEQIVPCHVDQSGEQTFCRDDQCQSDCEVGDVLYRCLQSGEYAQIDCIQLGSGTTYWQRNWDDEPADSCPQGAICVNPDNFEACN